MGQKKSELTLGEEIIDWIEDTCRIPEGKDVGKKVQLRSWQQRDIKRIYDNPKGTRRAIISYGRKNAKTTFAAFLLLVHLCGPKAKHNSQLYSAAQSRDQAGLLFSLAAKIVRMSPELHSFVVVRDTRKELVCSELGSIYRALSAEASTAYGLSPIFIVHDELGQVQGPRSELYDALETAVGAQETPLSVIISTQARTDADLLSVLIDDAAAGHDPRVILSLYTAPTDLDPFSEEAIKLANPALGDFLNKTEVMAMAEDARRTPSREPSYRNLVLNQRVEASAPAFSMTHWKACGTPVKSIKGVPVYGGLDLSEALDLTALVLIGKVNGVWQVHPTFWLPRDGLEAKAKRDRVPYDVWHQAGHLLAAPGRSVDYKFVAGFLRAQFDELDIRKLAFDRWGFKHLKPWLLEAGFSEKEIEEYFVEFGQGYQSMSPALRDLESEIVNQRIAHGHHPVLNMCMRNAVVQTDPAGSRKLTKVRSSGRIDGAIALLEAMGAAPVASTVPVNVKAMIA